MRLRNFILLLTLFCSSCHFLGPKDESNETPINGLTDLETLPGIWKATTSTYNLLKEKRYQVDSSTLILNQDSTFEVTNLPDCINSPFGDPVKGRLGTAKGKWNAYRFGDKWKLQMSIEKNEFFTEKTFLDFDIAIVDSTLRVSHYIGDPDEVDILKFEKER